MKQKKNRVIICTVFAIIFVVALVFCTVFNPKTVEMPEIVDLSTAREPDDFYKEFHNYVAETDLKDKNFVVSPLVFRTSMTSITEGANGNTQKEILNAMGFSTMEEYEKWYQDFFNIKDDFNKNIQTEDTFFNLENAIFNNKSFNDAFFKTEYIESINKKYNCSMIDTSQDKMGNDINQFLNDNVGKTAATYIKKNHDFTKISSAFVGTTQVKSLWLKPFTYTSSYKGDFLTKSGKTINKDYMKTTSYFNYYKDKNTELVSVPLEGNISVAFVVGDISNVYDNLSKSIQQEVSLTLPLCSISTQADSKLFEGYLENRGVKLGFKNGDFTNMTNEDFVIKNLMQSSEININETGVNTESASITVGGGTTASQKYTTFVVDESYYFFVYNTAEDDAYNTILFGQICE